MDERRTLSYRESDSLGWLELDRPPTNAMTARMVIELHRLLTEIASQSSTRVLVITGSGGPGHGFCPGGDFEHVLDGDAEREQREDGPLDVQHMQIPVILRRMPQVAIAGLNGAVAGAGLGLACACEVRVAAESAMFSSAFLSAGVAGDMGTAWGLSRVVGAARARELMYFPEKFDAATALHYGLVSRVYDDASFVDRLTALGEQLAAAAPAAVRGMKQNFIASDDLTLEDYTDVEARRHFQLGRSGAIRQGFEGLRARRPRQGEQAS